MLLSLRTGLHHVRTAPAVLVGVYLATLAAALPFALVLRSELQEHLGASLMADTAATGVNWDWWQEFSSQTSGLGDSFTPSIIGFAAPLSNLSDLLDGGGQPLTVIVAAVGYGALWLFLWGGILDRYARARETRTHGFFAACGVFFFRFLRLGVFAGVLYWVLLGPARGWLFETLDERFTRDISAERMEFAWRLGAYLIIGAALVLINLLVDYAKIRAVVEDRRSMIGALIAGARFIARQPAGALGLYALNGLLFVLVLAVYGLVSPGAGRDGLAVWGVLLVGQAYLLARLFLRLLFAASQICFFQSRLAHADYAAFPVPAWPESPDAESLGRTGGR